MQNIILEYTALIERITLDFWYYHAITLADLELSDIQSYEGE
jgi:hypothetical protein